MHWQLGNHSAELSAAAAAYYGARVDDFSAAPTALLCPLSESLRLSLRFYWDNCSSISLVKDLSLLSAVTLLAKPFRLGGVGAGILVTHVGALGFLPSALSTCYYSKEASANLISLGHLHRQGAKYIALPKMILGVYTRDNLLLDNATISDNNLPLVSSSLYSSYYELDSAPALISRPTRTFLRPNAFIAKMAGLSEEELSEVFHHVTQDTTLLGTAFYQAFVEESNTHVNKEQRARCDRAEKLHGICHISDDDACAALTNGHFTWTNLTPADIRLNRKLRGPCIQCLEGKSRRKAMPPSDLRLLLQLVCVLSLIHKVYL